MNAVDYLKTRERMCGKSSGCLMCPLAMGVALGCETVESQHPEEAVEIVERWSVEHPVETYISDFLKKFPNAILDDKGCPPNCVRYLYGDDHVPTSGCWCDDFSCSNCWNRPIKKEKCRYYKAEHGAKVCIGQKGEPSCKCGGDKTKCEGVTVNERK